jgi:hypothetical protein
MECHVHDIGLGPVLVASSCSSVKQRRIRPLFTATPNDDGATAAMTTNCGQLPTPNSVIGATTLTTASHGRLREAPRVVSGKPTRTGGAQRRGAEAARQHCPE